MSPCRATRIAKLGQKQPKMSQNGQLMPFHPHLATCIQLIFILYMSLCLFVFWAVLGRQSIVLGCFVGILAQILSLQRAPLAHGWVHNDVLHAKKFSRQFSYPLLPIDSPYTALYLNVQKIWVKNRSEKNGRNRPKSDSKAKKVQNPQKYVKIGHFGYFIVKTACMWPNLDELASNVLMPFPKMVLLFVLVKKPGQESFRALLCISDISPLKVLGCQKVVVLWGRS